VVEKMRGLCIVVLVVGLLSIMELAKVVQASRIPMAIQTEDGLVASEATSKSVNGVVEGVHAVITTAGVCAVQRAFTPHLVNHLIESLNLPPITGEEDIDILGLTVKIGYTVANLSIANVTFDQDTVDIVPGSGLSFSVANGGAKISADFAYGIPNPLVNLNGSGHADIDVSQLVVQLQVNVTADEKGYPVISCPKASVVLGQFNTKIRFNSSILDAIVEFFLYLFNGVIRTQIQDAINTAVYSNLNGEVNELIHNQSLHVALPPNGSQAILDVSLTSPPVFAPGYLLVPVKGEVFLSSGLRSNYTADPLPTMVTGQMLQLTVGEYFFNTAGWTYFKTGLLAFFLENSNLPSWVPIRLNTAYFAFILPALYKNYPDLNMTIAWQATETVRFNIDNSSQTEGIAVDLVSTLAVNVVLPNGQWLTVFDLGISFKLKFQLYFGNESNSVHGKFYIASFNATILSSQIGTFDVSLLNFILDTLFDNILLYPVNEYLSRYPLITIQPLAGFHFVNPALVYSKNYVTLSGDFAVTPQLAHSLGL
jgi:hypothetical protein